MMMNVMRVMLVVGLSFAGLSVATPTASASCIDLDGDIVNASECDEYAMNIVTFYTQCFPRYIPWYVICLGHTLEGTPCPPSPAC